jgi:putative transposase
MCKVLSVSRAGYYAWSTRQISQRKLDDKRILVLIKDVFKRSRDTYGYRRILAALRDMNEICSKHKILRLMRENNIRPKTRRKFKVTTNSKHNKPIHANSLDRQFNPQSPNQRWVADITYVPTSEGWLYLSIIMDLYSRKVRSDLLLHSDRGSQYASYNMQQLLRNNKIECSMSRKGNCWDNAVAESFFHSLKTECVYHERYLTRDNAKKSIFDYIEVFYNRQRRHSYLGYKSPEQYELSCGL